MRRETEAVYPGTFDPVTLGHIDLIERALKIFEKIIVAISEGKNYCFSKEERLNLTYSAIKERFGEYVIKEKIIEVEVFSGLLVDYLKKRNVKFIVRGLRAVSDFDYEFQMALTNRKLYPEVDTIFLMTDERYLYLSSSLVKEIGSFGGKLSGLVPNCVEKKLIEKFMIK